MPTDKTYKPHMGSKKTLRGGRYEPSHGNVCRVHCIGYIADVVRSPVMKIRWDKTFSNNGTSYSDKTWYTDLGVVSIRMISSRLGSRVVFWLPEKYLDGDQLSHWKTIEPRYVNVVYNEFQKRYDCVLGPIRRYQKPEFAFPEDSEFLFLAHKYNISMGNAWVDESEGSPEWETDDVELARVKMQLPERLLRLESSVDLLVKRFSRIEHCLGRFESSLKNLEFLLSVPARPFDWGDVSYG